MTVTDTRTPDWGLVEAAQAGDSQAFTHLWEAHRDIVRRYIYKYVRSWDVADDLTSETFTRAWTKLHTITDQGRAPGAWFVTIGRNLALDWLKNSNRKCHLVDDVHDDLDGRWPALWMPHQRSTDDQVIHHQAGAVLADLVARLSLQQQRVVHLRFVLRAPLEDTAAALGVNVGAAKALQRRAVVRLGQLLAEAGHTRLDDLLEVA